MPVVINGSTGISGLGNIDFASPGTRLTGDFTSSPTFANRMMIQTNIANGATSLGIIPNGTGTVTNINTFSSADPGNASIGQTSMIGSAEFRLSSSITGTGTYLPITVYTGGSERLRVDVGGNVTVSSPTGVLGYGTGAGGSVTQATSKGTTVVLNKPCGQITMNNAALASGASVTFALNNTLITTNDNCILSLAGGIAVAGDYRLNCYVGNSAQILITLTNQSAGSLSQSVVINFAIIKGATA